MGEPVLALFSKNRPPPVRLAIDRPTGAFVSTTAEELDLCVTGAQSNPQG